MIPFLAVIMAMLGDNNAFAQSSQSCDAEARAWADENLDALPQTLHELLAVPGPYRKAVYRLLAPEIKSNVWRAHLGVFLDTHPELSRVQQRALRDAISFASPDTFRIGVIADSRAARARDQRARALHRRFVEQFGAEQAGDLLGSLGADEGRATGDVVGTEGEQECECADADAYCDGDFHCDPGGCVKSNGGCGTLGLYDCDGLCKR
ncbi:MAG TPA: bacteriocin fulvocin C-related protein [Haliangium sp.]|nr:bacteriocin fulvocin C-related protein [Haliangium sp.]